MVPSRPLRRERSDSEFEEWLGEVTERLDPLMSWLGIMFALLVGFEVAAQPGPDADRALTLAGWSIWAVFLIEFLTKLWLAPRRGRFLRRHWLQALALLVPFLRIVRYLRLLRLGRALPAARIASSSYRTAGTARRLLRSRLAYLLAIIFVAAIALAELAFLFERDSPRGAFGSFGDAVLWSFSVVIAGQGDPVPNSLGARLAMLSGFAFGVVVVATLAGTLGAFFIDDRRERAEGDRSAS